MKCGRRFALALIFCLSHLPHAHAQQTIGSACPTIGWTTIQPNQIVYCNTSNVWSLGEEITSTGNVGIGTTGPLAFLDISQRTDAIALPGGTISQRPGSPVNGMIRYNSTTTPTIEAYISGAWQTLITATGTGALTLGTSATATNPQRSGEAGSGLYTAGTGKIDISSSGTQVDEFSATGENLTVATEGYAIAGTNVVWVPPSSVDSVAASIAIGYGTLTHATHSANDANTDGANGEYNTAVGQQALAANTGGALNVAVGAGALQVNTIGEWNTAVGTASLAANIGGTYNTAVGAGTFDRGTAVAFGTAIGYAALYNATGSGNTALGYEALFVATSGANNVAIGAGVASTTLTTGSHNILIGTSSAVDTPSSGSSNNLNIGNLLQGDMTYSTALGREVLYLQSTGSGVDYLQIAGGATGSPGTVTVSGQGTDTNININVTPKGTGSAAFTTGNVGIGTTGPLVSLDISSRTDALALPAGTISQRPGSPVNGMIRYNSSATPTVEAYVNGAWTALGATASSTNTLGTSAAATNPQRSGDATTGFYSATAATVSLSAAGTDILDMSASGANIAVGSLRLGGNNGLWQDVTSLDTVGGYSSFLTTYTAGSGNATSDTAFGYQALNANTTGFGNTAVGSQASAQVTSGTGNTAVGNGTLYKLTNGAANTALGSNAGFGISGGSQYNTALGASTLVDNAGVSISGSHNTGVGASSLYNLDGAASDNTMVGYSSGGGSTSTLSGSNNTAVGSEALKLVRSTAANNTALGYGALSSVTTGSGNLVIGYNVASTTLSSGSNNILLGTSSAVDTSTAGTSYELNIGNLIYGNLTGSAAQVGVAIGSSMVTAGSIFDLSSATGSTNSSLLLPVGTTGTRPTGTAGMIRYNSTIPGVEAYYGSAWNTLGAGNGGVVSLGTLASATNPQRAGDVTTGFYSAGVSTVAVATGGVEAMQWNTSSSGVNYISVTPGAAGTAPMISTGGSDTNGAGLGVRVVGTSASAAGVGGAVTLTAGSGNSTGAGGAISATGGQGGATSGGGSVTIAGGNAGATASNKAGGGLTLAAGQATGLGQSFVYLQAPVPVNGSGTTARSAVEVARVDGLDFVLEPQTGSSKTGYRLNFNGYYNANDDQDEYVKTGSAFEIFHNNSSNTLTIAGAASGTAGGQITYNTGLTVSTTGTVGIGTATPSATLDVNGAVMNECVAIAGLPTGHTGMRHCVTNATACSFMTAVTAGGSTVCPVFYNGSAWVGG